MYSYSLNTFALSCALALTVSVLGMGGYNVVLTCLDLSSVEMAQRQANMRYVRYRERVVRQLTKKAHELGLEIVSIAPTAQPA